MNALEGLRSLKHIENQFYQKTDEEGGYLIISGKGEPSGDHEGFIILLDSERDAIADRIEAEYMELPKDADGEVIHIGDIVELKYGSDENVEVYGVNDHAIYTQAGCHGAALAKLVKPEPPDSQARIDDDAEKEPCEYFGHEDMSCSDGGECRAASFHSGCYTCQRLDLLARQRRLDGVEA